MSIEGYSPEKESLHEKSWESFETEVYELIDTHKVSHEIRTLYENTTIIRHNSRNHSDGYKYYFRETEYGFYVRVHNDKSSEMGDSLYIGVERADIDTSKIMGKSYPGIKDYVLKFNKSHQINGRKTAPVLSLILNPTEGLLQKKYLAHKKKTEELSIRKQNEDEKSTLEEVRVTKPEISRIIEQTTGNALPLWHPALNIQFYEVAWEIVYRAVKG